MNFNFIWKQEFIIQKNNVANQKINNYTLKTFWIVIADVQIEDMTGKLEYFQETFLVADIKVEVILEMLKILEILFFKLINFDMSFMEETFWWNSYTTNKTLFTIRQIWIIDKKELVIAALDADSKIFVIHVAIWKQEEMTINSDRKT